MREMSLANRLWGIHGELLKLGIEVAQSTVAQIHGQERARAVADLEDLSAQPFVRHRRDGLPDRADGRLSATLRFGHPQARTAAVISLSVTAHPTAEWIAQQVTEAFPWDEAPDYMIRDRDASYGQAVTKRLAAMGIRDHPIAPRSPWQNGHAERLIGSIRRECLDHVVVFGEAHLRRILAAYTGYYNELRTHLSLGKDAPSNRPIRRVGKLAARPILGGLHHQYCRM
jgi:transposase InsO family protein